MHLLTIRNQRDDGWLYSSITFEFDGRLDLTADEQELFDRYGLHGVVIYNSDARLQHAYSAAESYQACADAAWAVPLFPGLNELPASLGNTVSSLWHLGAGLSHSLLSAVSLQVTLGSIVAGAHLESESLEEILAVEHAIKSSVQYLADYFQLALTYDGREEIREL